MSSLRLGVLVSGSGSNLQSVIDAVQEGRLESSIVCVVSNKKDAYGLERARACHIPAFYVDPTQDDYDEKVLDILSIYGVDLVVLAGYLKIIPESMTEVYRGRMINIHPSLLPKYGGKGYYGMHVHRAVIANGEVESGATVHYVDSGIDTGAVIMQGKVPVHSDDTAEMLQKRVLEQVEHTLLVEAIAKIEKEMHV